MTALSHKTIEAYRTHTFRLSPELHLKNEEEAIQFVNQRGFIFFWPIKDVLVPSLWSAVAGNRPVADAHDDPGHVTWGWKDSLLGKRQWYYAKVLRKRATIISLDALPHFYALSENYGSPEEDYLTIYEQGRLTLEAKTVYEALLDNGPLDTIALRKAARLTSPESETRFNRALTDLQADFKILPVGVTDAGAWRYAFAYDVVTRHFPELLDQARHIHENQARDELARLYFLSAGAAQSRELNRLFGWTSSITERTLTRLEGANLVKRKLTIENRPGEWNALVELCS